VGFIWFVIFVVFIVLFVFWYFVFMFGWFFGFPTPQKKKTTLVCLTSDGTSPQEKLIRGRSIQKKKTTQT